MKIKEENKKITSGICKNCKDDFFYVYKGKNHVFCSVQCRSDYFQRIERERYFKRKTQNSEPDLIPLPTFLAMCQKPVREVVDYINKNKIYHHTIGREWWISEELFKIFPVVKPLEAL